jgi:Holliday junction resolvasome RuvABC endonuclease subunit
MIIGIDPDIDKSGVAALVDGQLHLMTLNMVDLITRIRNEPPNRIKRIYVEAGWLNKKASWHAAKNMSMAANIGMKVGQNQAAGKLIIQWLQAMELPVVEVKPTQKKLNAEEFKRLTKYQGRTNQETRDAAMLIFGR